MAISRATRALRGPLHAIAHHCASPHIGLAARAVRGPRCGHRRILSLMATNDLWLHPSSGTRPSLRPPEDRISPSRAALTSTAAPRLHSWTRVTTRAALMARLIRSAAVDRSSTSSRRGAAPRPRLSGFGSLNLPKVDEAAECRCGPMSQRRPCITVTRRDFGPRSY